MTENNIYAHLNNLYKHTNLLIENRGLDILNENLDLFGDILDVVLEDSIVPNKSKLLRAWMKYCDKIFTNMIRNDMQLEAIEYMKKYFGINKLHEYKIQLDFYDTFNSLLNYVKEERSVSKLTQLPILGLYDDMLEGTSIFGEQYNDNDLPYLFSRYYVCLYKNTSIEKENKVILIKRLFKHLLQLPHYTRVKTDINKIKLVQKIIEEILKTSISLKDKYNFKYFLTILNKESYYSISGMDINKVFIKIAAYMYYLIEKEDLINQEDKHDMRTLVNENLGIIVYHLSNIYDLWKYYKDVQNSMSRWEHFDEDGDGKSLMMDGVIREFFYYLSIATGKFRIENTSEEILDENEMFRFFNYYTQGSAISEKAIKSYTRFKELFKFSGEKGFEELTSVHFALMERYKKFVLDRVREASNNNEAIKIRKVKITEDLNETLLENAFFKAMKLKQETSLDSKRMHILSISMPVEFIVNETKFDFLNIEFNKCFNSIIKKKLYENGFLYEEINYQTTNKIEILDKMITAIEKTETQINTLIYGIEEHSNFLYLETDENLMLYKKILQKISNKVINHSNEWVGFNNECLLLKYGEVIVEITKPTSDEVMLELEKVKVEDGYFITITNDISLKFNEEEAKEYLKISKLFINIYMNINIEDIGDSVGFILEIR